MSIRYPLKTSVPVEDRVKRATGKHWRRQMAERVAERDGAFCAECGSADRVVWRNIGYGAGDQWGDNPWERHQLTRVHPCSALELDHKTPLSQGGSNNLDNLWLLCVPCHKRKTSAERSARLKRLFAEAAA